MWRRTTISLISNTVFSTILSAYQDLRQAGKPADRIQEMFDAPGEEVRFRMPAFTEKAEEASGQSM